MAQKLEDIRVGSTGTISALMNKELGSYTSSSIASSSSSSSKRNPRPVPISVSNSYSIFKPRKSMDEAQSPSMKHKSPENTTRVQSRSQKQRRIPVMGPTTPKRTHRVPMLGSENASVEKTPKREKSSRKVSIVEVVDTNCGVPSGSLSNRLKKLSFSKLSHSII